MNADPRGGEFYEDPAVRDAYLRHRHSGVSSPNTLMEEPAILDALGALGGARVLDLGCGDGSTAGIVLAAGAAEYVGVDGSSEMISQAMANRSPASVRFLEMDLEDLGAGSADIGHEFDVVMSRMALHYLADLGPLMGAVHDILRPGGRFVFSIVHPVITSHDGGSHGPRTSWLVDDYFSRGSRERPWFGSTVRWHHRTIEDYVQNLIGHGFTVNGLNECEPQAELLVDDPVELARRRRVPLMMVLSSRRQ